MRATGLLDSQVHKLMASAAAATVPISSDARDVPARANAREVDLAGSALLVVSHHPTGS